MNKCKKKKKKTLRQGSNGKKMERFGLLYPRSAGIDVGSMLMIISYTDSQDMIQLREFDSFTDSLYPLADLLKQDPAVLEAKKIARLQKELAKYGYNIQKAA